MMMDQTRLRMEKMEAERTERRLRMKQARSDRANEEAANVARGNPGDVDFIGLVREWREEHAGLAMPHNNGSSIANGGFGEDKICVCVRKRPLNDKERRKKEHDAVTCLHPTATVHSAKLRVDGISKYLDHNSFRFDHAFDEESTTEDVYQCTAKPLVKYVCGGKGVKATVFCYGQTGSGKTHTMSGIQQMVADDIFNTLSDNVYDGGNGCSLDNTTCSIAIFEIYGGRIQDLLNNRNRLKVLEDGKGEVVVSGLEEFSANDPNEFLALVEKGHNNRTTHATEANDVSSRSHAICQILFRDVVTRKLKGKLSLVDLAGSERGTDTKSHNRQRRTESSEINTSLLALKECIRAIDGKSQHVPYRQSKLTLILKDCFVSKLARTAMIATLSPGSFSTDHTVNTLRYADRIKENVVRRVFKCQSLRVVLFFIYAPPPSHCPFPFLIKVGDAFGKESNAKRSPMRPIQTKKSPVQSQPTEKPAFKPAEVRDDYDELDAIFDDDTDEKVKVIEELSEFDQTVKTLLDEEEHLLTLHMSVIHENAELLTEESKLLQSVQGDDYDIDEYATSLGLILERKTNLVLSLKEKLGSFQEQLNKEEELSRRMNQAREYSCG